MIQLRRQRAIGQVCQRVITQALSQVRKKLDSRLDPAFHKSVNYFILVLEARDAQARVVRAAVPILTLYGGAGRRDARAALARAVRGVRRARRGNAPCEHHLCELGL